MGNREIKFRAWDKDKNKMLQVWLDVIVDTDDMPDDVLVLDGPTAFGWRGEVYELMQYAGLKDKHGKEIYEGDIIDEDNGFSRIYKVVWFDNGWSLSIEPYHNRHFRDVAHMKVIGNIYQHPHLLSPQDTTEKET